MVVASGAVDGYSADACHDLGKHIIEVIGASESFDDGAWGFYLPYKIPGAYSEKA